MQTVRFGSIAEPLASDPGVTTAAIRLVSRALYFGAFPFDDVKEISPEFLRLIVDKLADYGVGRHARLLLQKAESVDDYRRLLNAVIDQTEHSPMPSGEWRPLIDTLGEELLSELLGISVSSLRRYAAETRTTPEDVAGRLHLLAILVADLAGAYNDYGIRRWFGRRRRALGDRSPGEMLGPKVDPDGADAERLRELATALSSGGAT